MPRYIDADKLIEWAKEFYPEEKVFVSAIKNAPTADVAEVKHGEWVYGEFDIPHCSECGTEVMPCNISNYCPHCGAKMGGNNGDI